MLRSFRRDTRGGVAILVGTTFSFIAIAAAAGLDYTNATSKRHMLQRAADAAVLAAASLTTATDDERVKRAKEIFVGSKFCQEQTCETPVIAMTEGAVTFAGSAMIPTTLLQIAGVPEIEVGAISRAVPMSEHPLDVVMILDYSGSMNGGGKYQNMADAATQFIDSMDEQPGETMSVGVVPFSEYVLTPMKGRYLYDVSAGNNLMGQSVVGCVLNREHPYSTAADEPTSAVQGSLWPVFSYTTGSSPGTGTYSTDYAGPNTSYGTSTYSYNNNGTYFDYELTQFDNDPGTPPYSITATWYTDPSTGETGVSFDGHGKFNFSVQATNGMPFQITGMGLVPTNNPYAQFGGYGGSTGWTEGDDSGLPTVYDQAQLAENLPGSCGQYATNSLWVRPLSRDFEDLKTGINAMRPIGLTNIALGLDLGWHMLTPDEPFSEASTEEDAQKVAILLTDGVQTVQAHGSTGAVSISSANSNIAESCTAMKADGIEVFTIAFGINDAFTRTLLKQCATSEPHYFEPSAGGDLDAVFEGIFRKVVSGRVRLTG